VDGGITHLEGISYIKVIHRVKEEIQNSHVTEKTTYAVATRLRCSGATLCRRGLTGSLRGVEAEEGVAVAVAVAEDEGAGVEVAEDCSTPVSSESVFMA
jgi:hypothetical protein